MVCSAASSLRLLHVFGFNNVVATFMRTLHYQLHLCMLSDVDFYVSTSVCGKLFFCHLKIVECLLATGKCHNMPCYANISSYWTYIGMLQVRTRHDVIQCYEIVRLQGVKRTKSHVLLD